MKTKLENLSDHLRSGPDDDIFDLHAVLEVWQRDNGHMDKEEAFILLLCEISKEFPG